jgi:hypothetical protein
MMKVVVLDNDPLWDQTTCISGRDIMGRSCRVLLLLSAISRNPLSNLLVVAEFWLQCMDLFLPYQTAYWPLPLTDTAILSNAFRHPTGCQQW